MAEEYDIDPERLRQDYTYINEYWKPRNQLIEELRMYLTGRNAIEVPTKVRYKIKPVHTYVLASIVNEKFSRFMNIPGLQVVTPGLDIEARETSSKIERALSMIQYDMERKGDGDVWSRVTLDAILLDGGVERIDRAPQAFWPELAGLQASGASEETQDSYKKELGPPFRATYVPLEYTYPIYDASVITENFELEQRSLNAIISNTKMDSETRNRLRAITSENQHLKDIIVLHHVTRTSHAIYAVIPSSGGYSEQTRNDRQRIYETVGELGYLTHYDHGLNTVIYNYVSGRYGGWKTAEGGIIDHGKALTHLNMILDEMSTQIYTNLRATQWPTFKFTINPELRGYQEKGPPKAPSMEEGEDVTMFVGEDLQPLVTPSESPVLSWFFTMVQGQIARLGGNPSLFGESQAGVRTGYQQALQISEAEGIDAKIEQNLAQGAIRRGNLIMMHTRALGEKIWAHEVKKNSSGKKVGEYIELDPKWLNPLPRLDAKVRKPRPVDFLAAVRTAMEASTNRDEKGPLLSDDTIREEILARDEPDIELKKIRVEQVQNQVLASGVIAARVGDALNIKLAKEQAPPVNPDIMNQIDPTLLQAIQAIAQQTVSQGGLNPGMLGRVNSSGNSNLPPGSVPGDSQPEQRLGEAVSQAQNL